MKSRGKRSAMSLDYMRRCEGDLCKDVLFLLACYMHDGIAFEGCTIHKLIHVSLFPHLLTTIICIIVARCRSMY